MDALRHKLHDAYKTAAEAVLPVRTESAFAERGVLMPAEFVTAGDFLVRACPTWSWEGGDPAKARPYLPPDKQYLVTRNVPSRRRAAAVEAYGTAAGDTMLEGDADDGGWVAPPPDAAARGGGGDDAAPLLDDGGDAPPPPAQEAPADDDDDDIPGLDDLQIVGPADWADDAAALPPGAIASTAALPSSSVVATRTYDLRITYDKYYQVPRFWLSGYDEARAPLPPTAVLDDVSEEHARKTVTVDAWPHGSGRAASIHPCRHAAVMKKLADVAAGGGGRRPSADAYLVLFLKFIASVIPTIEYDFTLAAGVGGE